MKLLEIRSQQSKRAEGRQDTKERRKKKNRKNQMIFMYGPKFAIMAHHCSFLVSRKAIDSDTTAKAAQF